MSQRIAERIWPKVKKKSKDEPEARQFSREYGYNAELEWFFNCAGAELGEHGSAWHEFLGVTEPNTESSDLVVGWGKCLTSSPEKYRRVIAAFRLLPALTLEFLAARYAPITAGTEKIEGHNDAAWNVCIGKELKWVAIAVATEDDRIRIAKGEPATELNELFRAVDLGDTNSETQKLGKKWRSKSQKASQDAHAQFERARQFGNRTGYGELWVLTGELPKPYLTARQWDSLPYGDILEFWRAQMPRTEPEREPKPIRPPRHRVPRNPTTIQIQRGQEWALA